MRWRLIVLGCLAIAMAIGCVASTNATMDLQYRAQQIYGHSDQSQPTQAEMDKATRLSQQAWGLSILVTPLGSGSAISALAIPAVLARRWQLREAAASDPKRATA